MPLSIDYMFTTLAFINGGNSATNDMRRDGARLIIEGEFMVFSSYSLDTVHSIDSDYDIEIAELMAITGRGKHFVESGVAGYSRLRDLPRLRALQNERQLLDVPRLAAIDRTLSVLAPDTTARTLALFDDLLVDMFTSTRLGAALPSVWSVTRRLRRLVAEVDPSVDFNPVKRRQREKPLAPTARFFPGADGTTALNLTADAATMASVDAFVGATAREHKLGLADAMIKLLTGHLAPETHATTRVYAVGEETFSPRLGWLGDSYLNLFGEGNVKITQLDDASSAHTDSYTPTKKMAAFVRARDGACVFPGCHVPAERCQLDHRIPYGQGGETTPDNLHCLCQRHHNFKTDKRGFYIPDPATGETIWLFADGTWITSEAKGILRDNLTPTNPRWATTRERVRARRAHIARFNAPCHAACDEYDSGADDGATVAKIKHFEEEFDLTFDYPPQPEDLSWIPPEPDDTEPPYPDPLA